MKLNADIEAVFLTELGSFTYEDILFKKHKIYFQDKIFTLYKLNNINEFENKIYTEAFKICFLNESKKSNALLNQIELFEKIDFYKKTTEQTVETVKKSIAIKERKKTDFETSLNNLLKDSWGYNDTKREIKNIEFEIESEQLKIRRLEAFISDLSNLKLEFQNSKISENYFTNFNFKNETEALNTICILSISKSLHFYNRNFDNTICSIELNFSEKNLYNFKKKYSTLLKENNCIYTKDWKKKILSIYNPHIPKISGVYSEEEFINKNSIALSNIDYSFFISLKNNINNAIIVTNENIILLPLSGGVLCEIKIKKFDFNHSGLFMHATKNNDNYSTYKKLNLYNIDGYSNGSIDIIAPKGYLICMNDLLFELNFFAAPILFENNIIQRISNVFPADNEKNADEEYQQELDDDDYNKKIR